MGKDVCVFDPELADFAVSFELGGYNGAKCLLLEVLLDLFGRAFGVNFCPRGVP